MGKGSKNARADRSDASATEAQPQSTESAQTASVDKASPSVATNVETHPAVRHVKIQENGKMVDAAAPANMVAKLRSIFDAASDLYWKEGGIADHERALQTLETDPASLGITVVAFAKDCAEYAGGDPSATLRVFKSACAAVEQDAISDAIKKGTPKDKATIANLLPNWSTAKTGVSTLMALHRDKGGQYDIRGTTENKDSTGKVVSSTPKFANLANVRKVTADARTAARTTVAKVLLTPSTANVAPVTVNDLLPELKTAIDWQANIVANIRTNKAAQARFQTVLAAMLGSFVKAEWPNKASEAAPTSGTLPASTAPDKLRAAGGNR